MTAPRARQHDASSIRTSARVMIQASAVARAFVSLAADTVRPWPACDADDARRPGQARQSGMRCP